MKGRLLIAFLLFTTFTFAQNAGIDSLLYRNFASKQAVNEKTVETSGYRVQIYSSNQNQSAKSGAFDLEKLFTEAYPDIHAYITYSAPFWKVRVGDFASYFEALNFSNEIKEAFPERATEIFVVKEETVKPIYLKEKSTTETLEKPIEQ